MKSEKAEGLTLNAKRWTQMAREERVIGHWSFRHYENGMARIQSSTIGDRSQLIIHNYSSSMTND